MSTFLEALAEELHSYEEAQAVRRAKLAPPHEAGLAPQELRVLALLRTETLRVAAMTAGAASIANSLARKTNQAPLGRHDPIPLVPAFSSNVSEQVLQIADSAPFFEVYQLWLAAQSRLVFARDLSVAIRDRSAHAERPQILHADAVADAWCRACKSIIALFQWLARMMDGQGVSIAPPHEAEVMSMLDKAADGFSPCIQQDGSFSLPGWAERRKEFRRQLSYPVRVGVGIKTFPAILENISTVGLQITIGFMLAIDTRVVVHLEHERRLSGSVRWCRDGRAGIALDTALDHHDPLWSVSATAK